MTADDLRASPAAVASAWVGHLRGGGTTPWSRWRGPLSDDLVDAGRDADRGPGPGPGPEGRPIVPGAQQLELLRVLNTLGEPDRVLADRVRADRVLADRVLTASGLGRGRADLPLLGGPRTRFGPPGVDPEDLPVEELLRVGVLLVADDLAARAARAEDDPAAPPAAPATPERRRGPRLRRRARRGFRLAGDPWTASRLEVALRERGRPPGGRHARVHVLAGPVDALLADVWTARCFTDPPPPWPRWLDAVSGGGLPPGADVAGTAEARARRVGPSRVVLVTDVARVPRLLGVRRLPLPAPLGAAAADLARRVGEALDVVVPPENRPALLREHLLPLLVAHQEPGPALTLPARHEAWARRCAERQRHRVREAGYAVAGDVDDLMPGRHDALRPGDRPAVPDDVPEDQRVLRLAGRLIVAGARQDGAGGGS